MLSHSPGVRSASERGCVTPEQLRRNFFRSFFSRRFLRRPRTFAGKRNSPLERRAFVDFGLGKELERAKGLEPSTPTLARLGSYLGWSLPSITDAYSSLICKSNSS